MPNNTTTKKKTKVSLPGSLKSLVHNVQEPQQVQVTQQSIPAPTQPTPTQPTPAPSRREGSANESVTEAAAQTAQVKAVAAAQTTPAQTTAAKPAAAVADEQPAEPARTVTRESTADSWGLFLDLAREYKEKDSHLATIYIDRDLKTVLDRLRASRDVRMPTTAILSAIVARFIYDNEQRIKDAIYGDRLI